MECNRHASIKISFVNKAFEVKKHGFLKIVSISPSKYVNIFWKIASCNDEISDGKEIHTVESL